MKCKWKKAGSLITFSCAGGWGKERDLDEWSERVYVLRGADFPAVENTEKPSLVQRWEKPGKVEKAALKPGDIVLEISGGTDDRPTGRSVLITKDLLSSFDAPVIPASFCRLLRPGEIDGEYFYYWLQDMYAKGRTWNYQNRSTGLSNFQYKVFQEEEQVCVPPRDMQRRIAAVLSDIDAKKRLNRRINGHLSDG